MADAPKHADFLEIAREEMTANNSLLVPGVIDVEGHPANIIANVGAAMGEEVSRQLTRAESQMFLDTAGEPPNSSDDLDRLVYDRYGIVRLGASPSVGEVQFTRPNAAYGGITIASGTVLLAEDGTRFMTTADATFGALALGPITAKVRSEKAGAGQAADAGEITEFETTPLDSSILVTNSAATAGDADTQTNAELIELARKFWLNARRGTLSAIEYGALQTPSVGVRFAVATEVTTSGGEPARWVKLQVADRNGNSNSALTDAVELEMREWRPAGMKVQIIGSTVTFVSITIALTVDSDYDSTAVSDAVKAAAVSALSLFVQGQILHHSDIIAAAKAVPGVTDATVSVPAAALEPDDEEIFRTKINLVTVTSS